MKTKDTKKYPKSPLRYPGGKTRGASQILSLIPRDVKTIVSPFFGGGSVEIAFASLGNFVYGYDIFDPLVNFWQKTKENAPLVAEECKKYLPLSKIDFYRLQGRVGCSTIEDAAMFFVLNRSSFNGATLRGGMSPMHPRFNMASIEYLSCFEMNNIEIYQSDYKNVFRCYGGSFFYLDPPYFIKSKIYGNKKDRDNEFDHAHFSSILHKIDRWILSYNNCDEIKDLYSGYRFLIPEWKYGMSVNKESNEIIIVSNDIEDSKKYEIIP